MTIFDETKLQQGTQKILPAIYLIWAGLIVGVSFIATPVKFQAPNLTMPVALEVGKATFHLFNVIEWSVIITAIILTNISASKNGLCLLYCLHFLLFRRSGFCLFLIFAPMK